MERSNLFYRHQYGFRKGLDCQQPLVYFSEKIRPSLDKINKCFSLAVFVDFKKAFDTIPFNLLLEKLNFNGIEGNELKWFKSYLNERYQMVEIDGVKSDNKLVKIGVPQGSILGPLLFLIYINDLPNCVTKSVPFLFADDTTIVKSGTNLIDLHRDMNEELFKLQKCCEINKLSLNNKETKYILFKLKNKHVHFTTLIFRGAPIERIGNDCETKAFKFLGHWVDDNLTWDIHTNKLINKLNSANFALSKVKTKFPFKARLTIYNSLVHSNLMWGSLVTGVTSKKM